MVTESVRHGIDVQVKVAGMEQGRAPGQPRSVSSGDPDLAFPPYRLPAHARPLRGPQEGDEFAQFALIFRFAHEAADRVYLSGPAAAPRNTHLFHAAARHAHPRGALADCARAVAGAGSRLVEVGRFVPGSAVRIRLPGGRSVPPGGHDHLRSR